MKKLIHNTNQPWIYWKKLHYERANRTVPTNFKSYFISACWISRIKLIKKLLDFFILEIWHHISVTIIESNYFEDSIGPSRIIEKKQFQFTHISMAFDKHIVQMAVSPWRKYIIEFFGWLFSNKGAF